MAKHIQEGHPVDYRCRRVRGHDYVDIIFKAPMDPREGGSSAKRVDITPEVRAWFEPLLRRAAQLPPRESREVIACAWQALPMFAFTLQPKHRFADKIRTLIREVQDSPHEHLTLNADRLTEQLRQKDGMGRKDAETLAHDFVRDLAKGRR
jgi:hypothetical protein